MINQIITYLLDKLIGNYVENFTSQNVKTGILKGDIQLDNLSLKQNVLEDLFEWPILLKSGLIGRVILRIPYTRFRSQAAAILIEDIYIIAEPHNNWKFAEKEFQNENRMKKIILDSLEAKWRKKIKYQVENSKVESTKLWVSYIASLGYRILSKIQIEVRNVHIRYEDSVTIPSQMFVTGLIIDEFSTKSSDFEWDSKNELKSELDIVNKKVDLNGIKIYLDAFCKEPCKDVSLENIKSVFNQKIKDMPESYYIVKPISLHGTMKRNINARLMNNVPRISLHLQMNLVEVSLSQLQFKAAMALSEELDRFDRQKHHMKYKPQIPVMDAPRQWWKFAISEHIREVCKGTALMERARDLVSYVQSYEDYLLAKDNSDQLEFRKKFETELEVECLIHLREVAMERVSRKNRELIRNAVNNQASQQSSWWDYIWGRRNKDVPEIIEQPLVSSETTQILEKILPEEIDDSDHGFEQDISEILKEVDYEAVNFFTRDKIFLRGEFSLDGIAFNLLEDYGTPILGINASNLIVGFESRPQYSSWYIRIGLRSLFVQDLRPSNKETSFRDVVSSMERTKNLDGEVFALAFEKNPLLNMHTGGIKRILAIASEPLTIVHCPMLIEKVQNYFSSLRSTKDIQAVAEKHIRNATNRTSASIKNILNKGSSEIRWWLSLKISAPKIIFPNFQQNNTKNPGCVLVDLGRLQVSNSQDQRIDSLLKMSESEQMDYESDVDSDDFMTPASSPIGSLEDLSNEMTHKDPPDDSNLYDEYSIVIENIMALVGTWDDLHSILSKNSNKNKNLLLMEPFNLLLTLKRKCILDKLGKFPNLILESTLSKLLIRVSDHKLELVNGCMKSLTNFMNNCRKSDKSTVKQKKQSRVEDMNKFRDKQNVKSVSISFVLHSFIVQLESRGRPLAELSLTEAQFELAQYPMSTIINVQLLNLVLADARANLGPKLDFILASHKSAHINKSQSYNVDDPIIEFSYQTSITPGSSTLQHKANLIFSELDVIANQETLTELISFLQPLFSEDSSHQSDLKADTPDLTKYELLDVSIISKAVSILLIKISSKSDSENRFAESVSKILLSYMNLRINKSGSHLSSTIRVRSVNVEDISTPDSVHRKILTLTTGINQKNVKVCDTEDIINITVVQKHYNSRFYISGTMPHIIYVHSPQFVYSVERCISEFQKYFARLKNTIAAVARTAILSGQENNEINFLNNIRLNLKMLSPILALPRHKSDNEIILVNLGDIKITNDMRSLGDIENTNDMRILDVVFTDAVVISKKLPIVNDGYDISICTDNNAKFPLVDKIDLHLTISRSVDIPKILINCEFSSSLTLSFSQPVYEQVLKSMDNLVYDDDDNSEIEDGTLFFEHEDVSDEINTDASQSEIPITLESKISQIRMELYPKSFENCEDPMMRLLLQGISFKFVRINKYIRDIEFIVDQISMYQILDFRHQRVHKLLIYSLSSPSNVQEKCASCPDLLEEAMFNPLFDQNSSTLPKHAMPNIINRKKSFSINKDMSNMFSNDSKIFVNDSKRQQIDKLAKINIRLIEKKIPEFSTEYESINRFVDADFNQLTLCISTEAWVILLDFFGLGSKFYDPMDIKDLSDVSKVLPSFNRRYDGQIEEINNTRLNMHVKRFSLILENEIYYSNLPNLASISAMEFDLEAVSRDGNLTLSGSLSDFLLTDLSPTGSIYNERLFPSSNQARIFEFEIFNYGLPDPSLIREEDVKLFLKISAPIVYVHTQRFLQELNQFFQNFLQYQNQLSHHRVTDAGRIVDKSAQRSARIRLKVSCQAPILLLPVSAFNDHFLVIDLGKFSLANEFKFVNNDSNLCLLDEMRIDLQEMDVYSAIRLYDTSINNDTDLVFPYFTVRPIFPKPLSVKCDLNLIVSRNLNSNISNSSPDWQLYGVLSSAILSLNIDQYRTVRGVLAHNLGENIDHLKSYKFQAYQTDPTLQTDLTGISWLALRMELCLKDVKLNLMSQLWNANDKEDITLCRLNLFQSKLLYESYSDASIMITLACQQITVEDLRYVSCPANKRLNVFQTIISPDRTSSNTQDSLNNCQLHITYSSNCDQNKFVVKLNKMKAITIFDWLQVTKKWIFTPPYEIVSLAVDEDQRFDKHVAFYIQSKPQSGISSAQPQTMRKYYQEIIQGEFKPTELTFDVQESRFFILEDSSQLHSHALILIVAGSCSYQTRENRPGPFSFSVSQFHLASCAMSSDTSNLLSIINPVEIRIKSEERLYVTHGKPSLDDVLHEKDSTKLGIKVAVSAFQIRLSFSDIQLLAKIIQSFQNQTIPPANLAYQTEPLRHRWSSINPDNLGSTRLLQPSLSPIQRLTKFVDRISIHHLAQEEFVSVCLIDDCFDADVPLFDIKLNNVTIDLELGIARGTIKALLSVEYYNTNSFGWTPVIEPWLLSLQWFWQNSKRLVLESKETLNVDVSSHLLEISKSTHKKWSSKLQEKDNNSFDFCKRHHNVFVPFLIVNKLGCPLKYRKLSLNNPPMYDEIWKSEKQTDSKNWIEILDSTPSSLFFDMETTARDKIRYDSSGSHFNTSHRIELALEGWSKCQPITVDKLGVFYRHLQKDTDPGLDLIVNHIRIVIEIVVIEGSVQNKIIIRSPLQLHNTLNIPLEVKFMEKSSVTCCSILNANKIMPIPLFSVMHNIQVRPLKPNHDKPGSPYIDCLLHNPLDFSENLFSWCTVKSWGQKLEAEVFCPISRNHCTSKDMKGFHYSDSNNLTNKDYLICSIERLNFPLTPNLLPGHLVTISAPFTLENRLPCDLTFAMESQADENGSVIINKGCVKHSSQCTVLTTSMRQPTNFYVYLDLFCRCEPLLIHGLLKLSQVVLIRLYDELDRPLELEIKVESRPSGPVSIVVSALYWIVNRTSLPLVYAQSSEIDTLAAGHVPANEQACSSIPFPFNFSNAKDSFTFRVRLGAKAQISNMGQFKPLWGEKISLEKIGTKMIQLRAASLDHHRPHLVYNIGLEIRPGQGKHSNTKMVILTARYLLDNKSSNPLYFVQYNLKDEQNKPIKATPNSLLTFHWPRDDLDQLLTVQKLDSYENVISKFSGGFQIDQCNSFHIYLRGMNNYQPSQLRVTISLEGARYRVVFTDVDDLPSPYRLENQTCLQVFFYQSVSESMFPKHSVLPPKSSISYALDEPTLPPNINLCIEGGTQACYDINKVGPGASLYYDNFLYMVAYNQFQNENDIPLVFDVPQNSRRIFLNPKSSVSRSQLWYYSQNCELFHEGSIAPHDPKQKLDRSAENHLLLDVDILAPCPSSGQKQMYRMILAKADPRRDKYQRWYFLENGCLINKLGMKCYINTLCKTAPVFSGFNPHGSYYSPLVHKNWLRPGSGEVLVSVVMDGPTRVLRLIDKSNESRELVNVKETSVMDSSTIDMTINIKGFGVFLINHLPEELLYAVCNDIHIQWTRKASKDSLHVKIGKIQIDNQQMDTGYPCVMYEENKSNSESHWKYAFNLKFEKELNHPYDVSVFSFIKVHIVPMCVILEEKMLLKTLQMFWKHSKEAEILEEDIKSSEQQSHFHEGRKIYIGKLFLDTGAISLTVITVESLPSDLKRMKKLFPSLMSFTNAQITIDPYERNHVFETIRLIVEHIRFHYRNQLKSQAIKIFGSVDFLGNPIGLISDITSGVKRFCNDKDVYNMVKHFAHGIGDSTAKICSSASRVISDITMDPEYEETRQKFFETARISGSNTAQVRAGFKSLAYGIMGGIKSVPNQLDKGFKDDGASGLFVGALKGIVGVVTKPVGGMLDLATGSATSFREIARSSKEGQPPRRYEPRCLSSSWKLLPFYTTFSNNLRRAPLSDLTQAQHLLAKFSDSYSLTETVVGFLIIQNSKESQLKVIVSDTSIHIVKTVFGESSLLKHYPLVKLGTPPISVQSNTIIPLSPFCKNSVYINFNYLRNASEHQATPRPPFKCDTVLLAKQLVKLVCEAHCDYLERQMTYKSGF